MQPTAWAWSLEVNGYYIVDGLFLSPHALGAVSGDDDHCRAVCTRVGGCNSISRQANSRQCLLDTACPGGERLLLRQSSDTSALREPPGATTRAVQRRYGAVPHSVGAVTMFAMHCRPVPQWHNVPYMLAAEGAHISVEWATSPERCKQLCEVTASCNAVRWRWWKGRAECHLKAQCTEPGSSAASKVSTAPQGKHKFVTELKWPCVDEVGFPTPGLRRSLPPDEPTGLLSFDCAAARGGAPRWAPNASGCIYLRPAVAAAAAARSLGPTGRTSRPGGAAAGVLPGSAAPGVAPEVTELRWPSFYAAPSTLLIRPRSRRGVRAQRRWQGADGQMLCSGAAPPPECPPSLDAAGGGGDVGGGGRGGGGRGGDRGGGSGAARSLGEGGRRRRGRGRWRREAAAPVEAEAEAEAEDPRADTLFVRVARRVAAGSFNGREVVLVVSNANGLPMTINMAASLAQHGHQHVLLLANEAATCNLLRSDAAPACLWSSLLRRWSQRMRGYGVHKGSVQLLWLQRWCHPHRLALALLTMAPLTIVWLRLPWLYSLGTICGALSWLASTSSCSTRTWSSSTTRTPTSRAPS
jgi:hypothetical protein